MGKETKKKDKLTIKERKFLKALTQNGGNVMQAAMSAGYAKTTASTEAYSILDKPRVQTAFQSILEKQGITDEKLGQAIKEGLDAYKVISANIIKNKSSEIADEQDGMKDADESTKDFVEVPDFMARHKFVDTVLKLKSHYPAEKHEVEHKGFVRLITNVEEE